MRYMRAEPSNREEEDARAHSLQRLHMDVPNGLNSPIIYMRCATINCTAFGCRIFAPAFL